MAGGVMPPSDSTDISNTGNAAVSDAQKSGFRSLLVMMVPRKGLEPSRPLSHWHLKPARLPIPPPGPGRVSKDRSRACQIGESRAALLFFGPSPFRKTGAHFSGAVCKYTVQRGWVGVSRIR